MSISSSQAEGVKSRHGQTKNTFGYGSSDIWCFAWDGRPNFFEKKYNQPKKCPNVPHQAPTSAVFETFFSFTHSHIYKSVKMKAHTSSRGFQNKTLICTGVF